MPTDLNKNQIDAILSPALITELERVVSLIREKASQSAIEEGTLALVRVVKEFPLNEWEQFASLNSLENWLAIPLDGELGACMASLIATLEHLAFQRDHDSLTGLANRRLFERRLGVEIERAVRSGTELCLMMLDLDSFKKINDTYGHQCGDEVLQRLGTVLQSSVRAYDLAARIGGEEFALIFPATSCWTGSVLGNRILHKFSEETFEADGTTFSVTFSGGVSCLALLDGHVTSDMLVADADEALYAAKRAGKNRVLISHRGKISKDRATLVQSHEKQLLFSSQHPE